MLSHYISVTHPTATQLDLILATMQRDSLRPSLPHHAQSSIVSQPSYGASAQLFRRLVWEGTIPIEIRIDGKELPAGSDRNLESYYVSLKLSLIVVSVVLN